MSSRMAVGARVRVKDGISAPDIPEVSIAGWTGTITQVSKKKSGTQFFVEWDEATQAAMSEQFRQLCEERMLYHAMACLAPDDLELLGDDK